LRTDGQNDLTSLIVSFRNLANALKNTEYSTKRCAEPTEHDLGLLQLSRRDMRSSGLFRGVWCLLLTDVSTTLRIGTLFKPGFKEKIGPIGCAETSARNHYKLRSNPEERRSHLGTY